MQVRQGSFSTGLPYVAFGAGQPLVYLCGFTTTHVMPPPGIQGTAGKRLVTPFVEAGYQVFWTNRRPGMTVGMTMSEIAAEHAEALRDRFGRPVPVIGHSTGGSIALQLGVENSAVISRLVLASTAYSLGPAGQRFQREMVEAADRGRYALHRAAPGLTRSPVLQRLVAAPLWVAGQLSRPPKDHTDMKAMLLLAEDAFDVRDRLAEVTVPTLVIWGARDYFWTTDMFAETASGIPGARRVEYPNWGHGIVTKAAFFRDVLAFLGAP